ncbi:MAG: hypothetical protein V4760_02920 [Bdellovibrionota bacterium]
MGTKQALTIIAVLGFTLVGFQNCSPVNFDTEASAAGKLEGSGTDDSNDQTDTTTVDDYVNNDDENPTPEEVDAVCDDAKLTVRTQGLTPTFIPAINDYRGSSFFYVTGIGAINDYRGKIVVVGAPGASIAAINDTRGKAIFCGVDILAVNDARGNYHLLDGSIGAINTFRGTLRAIDSTIGTINDQRGNIKLTRSTITGPINNAGGNIQYQ